MGEIEEIQLLEARLNELKVAYEKYFAGVEKLEPARLRDEVQRIVRKTGTFSHHQYGPQVQAGLRSSRSSTRSSSTGTASSSRSRTGPTSATSSGCASRTRRRATLPPTPRTRRTTTRAPHRRIRQGRAAQPGRLQGARATQPRRLPRPRSPYPRQTGEYDYVYQSLVAAKQKLGEPTENISYSALEWSLKKEAETIKKKFNASRVDFKVEIKDGKPVIKAVPVK